MSNYGVTQLGFRRKTYAVLEEELRAKAKEIFGNDLDLSQPNIMTFIIQLMAWAGSDLWETAEEYYLSGVPAYATGESLSNLGSNIGIIRRPAQPARGYVIFTGDNGTEIPRFFNVNNTNGIVYQTAESVTIADGKAKANVVSLEVGEHTNSLADSVTELSAPLAGIDSVGNPEPIIGGSSVESDSDFYARYLISITRGGGSTAQAVKSALLATTGVVTAEVLENVTESELDGIPAKSIAPYVYGGESEAIASTILRHKAGGIRSFGTTETEVTDEDGTKHTIGFTRVKETKISLELTFSIAVNEDLLKRAVINYIGGIDKDNITYKGLGLGQDVTLSGVIGAVMCLGGIDDVIVKMGKSGEALEQSNVAIDSDSVAITDYESIVINYA